MADELKKDEIQAEADATKVTGWVKTHVAWLIGLGAFIVGALAGHLIR
jgi:hypothetical protein